MSCPTPNQLAALLDEQSPPAEQAVLEAHVEQCPACQRVLTQLVEQDAPPGPAATPRPASESSTFLDALRGRPPEPPTSSAISMAPLTFPGGPTAEGPLGQLEQFHIQALLGKGAFGFVYRAWDETLRKTVALKVLKPELAADPLERARFEREARKAAAVRHEHVIAIHRLGSCPGFAPPFLVMEFIEGESLQARLDRTGALPPAEAARIARQVALGLAAAHAQGVVHRDIKPSNIMLDQASGQVKLTDFGLARAADGGTQLTHSGGIAGTPAYMSPEQIRTPQQIDGRSDLFSLGCVLYVMLSGTQPFRGALHMVLQQVVNDEPTTLRRLNNLIPLDLETITLKCLAKEAARRYATATEVAEELRRWATGEPIVGRPVGRLERSWRWARRNPALALTSGLATLSVLLILIGAIAFAIVQKRANDESRAQLRLAARMALAQGCGDCEQGDVARGLLWFVEGTRLAPNDDQELQAMLRRQLTGWRAHAAVLRASERLPGRIGSAWFSPDGQTLLLAGTGKEVHVWKGEANQRESFQAAGTVSQVHFDPSGERFLTLSDEVAELWSGSRLVARDAVRNLLAVSFPPDEAVRVAQADEEGVQVRPLGQPAVFRRDSARDRIIGASFSRDGGVLLLHYSDRIESWDWARRKLDPPLPSKSALRAAALSPDTRTIAASSADGRVRLWNRSDGRLRFELEGDAVVTLLAFSPDGTRLLTDGAGRNATMWNVQTGEPMYWLDHPGKLGAVGFSADGASAFTRSAEDHRCWDVATGRKIAQVLPRVSSGPRSLEPSALAIHPAGRLLVTANAEGQVKLWQPPACFAEPTHRFELASPQHAFFHGDGRTVRVHGAEGEQWECAGRQHRPLNPARRKSGQMILSPDGTLVLHVSMVERRLHLEVGRDDTWTKLVVPAEKAASLRYPQYLLASHDRQVTIVGSRSEVFLFEAGTGKLLRSFQPAGRVTAMAAGPTAPVLLVGSDSGVARLWNLDTAQPTGATMVHELGVVAVGFDASGRQLRTISSDGRARLWDRAGAPLSEALLLGEGISGGAFCSCDPWLACHGNGESVRLWDSQAHLPLGAPLRHPGSIQSVAFHPRQAHFLTLCTDNSVRLWDIPAPMPGPPDRLRLWVEVLTGMEMDANGIARMLDGDRWRERRRALDRMEGRP